MAEEKKTEQTAAEKKPVKKAAAKKTAAPAEKKAAPKKAAAKKAEPVKTVKTLTITLKKSLIACKKNQIDTARSLGLKRPGNVTVQPDNAATRGKINTICHMVEVH